VEEGARKPRNSCLRTDRRSEVAGSTLRSGGTTLTDAAAPAWKVNEVLEQTRLNTLVRIELIARCSSSFA
jgi:hypothetical protein